MLVLTTSFVYTNCSPFLEPLNFILYSLFFLFLFLNFLYYLFGFLGFAEKNLWFPGKDLNPNIKASIDRCRIPTKRLSVGKELGKGNFGLVHKGQLVAPSGNLKTVAVKTLKGKKKN